MLSQFTNLLKTHHRVIFLGGAGVSTESGIPDFRSTQGRYRAPRADGRSLEETLGLRFFLEHPEEFFASYRTTLDHRDVKPNPAHLALARLEQMGKLRAVITQNVDGLHQAAGSVNVLELHGSGSRAFCMVCKKRYAPDALFDPSRCLNADGSPGVVPHCEVCGGVIRPDVVLYEEQLDQAVLEAAMQAVRQADLLLVGGTSLVVYPAAGLLEFFRGDKLVLINRDPTPYDDRADLILHGSIGRILSKAVENLEALRRS